MIEPLQPSTCDPSVAGACEGEPPPWLGRGVAGYDSIARGNGAEM